jgi:colanic acid biosynthesis glycosyl transferase WcaI
MRIVLVNQYFYPDMAATAQLLADLASDLAAAGHEVYVLSGRGSYAAERKGVLPRLEQWKGVHIRRLWCTNLGRGSRWCRLSDYLTFLLSAGLALLFSKRANVTVCLSTPPLVALIGLIGQFRGSRFVYKVEDLYPDVAVAVGQLSKRSFLTRILFRMSSFILSRADRVVALDEAMSGQLSERGSRQVRVIPNWADGDAIRPDPEAGRIFRTEHGIEDQFVVLYSGNLGMAHRFDAVIDAAKKLAEERVGVIFLFVGGGPRLQEVKTDTAALPNVRFMEYQPRARLNQLYNAVDLHLITMRDEVAGLLVPSKYAAALAAGKPVLLVGGEGADLFQEIEELKIGWVCRHDSLEVREAIVEAINHPGRSTEMGESGRRVFENRYSHKISRRRWMELMESLEVRS